MNWGHDPLERAGAAPVRAVLVDRAATSRPRRRRSTRPPARASTRFAEDDLPPAGDTTAVSVTPTPPVRPPVVVPREVEVAVAWTWRLVLLAGGVVLLGLALGRVLLLTAAFAAALLLTAVLHPLAVRVQHVGVPRRLAAAAVFLAFVTGVGLVLATLGGVVGAQLSDLTGSLSQAGDRVLPALQSSGLPVDQRQLDQLRGQFGAGLQGGVISRAVTAVGTLLDLLSGALLALFIVLVLLLDGRTVWSWVLHVLPRAAQQPADEAGTVAWQALTGYMHGIVVVALVDSTLIAVALLLIGVPAVAPLAALTASAPSCPTQAPRSPGWPPSRWRSSPRVRSPACSWSARSCSCRWSTGTCLSRSSWARRCACTPWPSSS
jgi:hypothetical protein